MSKLIVFNNVTVDGYIAGPKGEMGWTHKQDPEWDAFIRENASGDGTLLFGRVTYEMMASYWPTPMAAANMPVVAQRINSASKVVFSKTLKEASWNNTRLLGGDLAEEVQALKKAEKDLVILGSGSIVSQLAQAGLIDVYQLVIHPVILGSGKSQFAGVDKRLDLKFASSRIFGNGNVLLCYENQNPGR